MLSICFPIKPSSSNLHVLLRYLPLKFDVEFGDDGNETTLDDILDVEEDFDLCKVDDLSKDDAKTEQKKPKRYLKHFPKYKL